MKRLTALSMIASVAVLVTSCAGSSPNGPNTPTPPSPDPEKVEIRISPSIVSTRATDYGFETGDCIGLYVVNYEGTTPGTLKNSGNHVDNMSFVYNGTWTPGVPVYWNDNTTHADFYLYYPYATVNSVDAYQFDVKADQSDVSAYKTSDLLVGNAKNVAPTEAATSIPANHVMSRVMIYLEAGKGFTKESLAASKITVKVNGVKCGSTVNLATGAVSATGDATAVTPLLSDNVYKAIIVPQTVAEGNLITVNVDGRDFNLQKAFVFEAGKSHKFTVTLSKTSNGVNVNINPWADDGVDNGGTAE